MKRILFVILFMILAVIAVRLSCYTVDASEYAYVTVLGQHVATHDGGADGAGLHVGWPWPVLMVQRLDRRLQQFDLPALEQLTHDEKDNTIDKRLLIEAYVCWRIADPAAVDLFVSRIGSAERARAILAPRINSQLGAAFGLMKMDDLVNTSPSEENATRTRVDDRAEKLRRELLAALSGPLRSEYGIELVDVRLRRFNHPASVRGAIFDRIRSERQKKVTEYRSEGERLASNIRSEAEEKVREMLARARSEEVRIKGQADTQAMQIRNQAHSQDPEFYTFLQQLEKLKSVLGDNKTVLLLSTHRPFFDLLTKPPRPEARMPAADRKEAPSARKEEGRP
jgi:membrane protease subunit HflC